MAVCLCVYFVLCACVYRRGVFSHTYRNAYESRSCWTKNMSMHTFVCVCVGVCVCCAVSTIRCPSGVSAPYRGARFGIEGLFFVMGHSSTWINLFFWCTQLLALWDLSLRGMAKGDVAVDGADRGANRCVSGSFHWKCSTPEILHSRNSDSSVSRGTTPDWDFDLIWICAEKFEFLDLVEFGDVAFSVQTVIDS